MLAPMKRTKEVGIIGKYDTVYRTPLLKTAERLDIIHHENNFASVLGRTNKVISNWHAEVEVTEVSSYRRRADTGKNC